MSDETTSPNSSATPICGIIMPISSIDGCSESHWIDVQSIVSETVKSAGFVPNLVSVSEDIGVIQKRIIQNIYDNPVVVCDVSGKNPNVMFELGLRLAFDKPTIIIKDDKTDYSFDTSPIEHLGYPRDLRFQDIVSFKDVLKKKIESTYERSRNDQSYTTFLGHFGTFNIAKLNKKEISRDDYVLDQIQEMKGILGRISSDVRRGSRRYSPNGLGIRANEAEFERFKSDAKDLIELFKLEKNISTERLKSSKDQIYNHL